jgi:hypothetical protein
VTSSWTIEVNLILNRYQNQEPLPIQKTFVLIKQPSNPLPISIKPIQPIQPKLVELVHPKLVYIFLETSIAYVQHKSLKQVTFFFKQIALIA